MSDYVNKFRDVIDKNKMSDFEGELQNNISELTDGLGLIGGSELMSFYGDKFGEESKWKVR